MVGIVAAIVGIVALYSDFVVGIVAAFVGIVAVFVGIAVRDSDFAVGIVAEFVGIVDLDSESGAEFAEMAGIE